MAEEYYNLSPYSWLANNFLRYIDPTGMVIEDPYLLFNGARKQLEVWDDNNTPDNYDDDVLLSMGPAKNDVTSSSNGKWEDGVYDMLDTEEAHMHGDATDGNGVLRDSDNGSYGSGGIFRAENFEETTTDLTRTGMGFHAGRENQDWDTGRKTLGCVRCTPETFDNITKGIETNGPLTKVIIKNNRQSDNTETVNKIIPGLDGMKNEDDFKHGGF